MSQCPDLNALRSSITEILALSRLSGVFSRLGIIAYHDYCDNKVIKKSGWNSPKIREFLDALGPWGGGDWPEAAKSALIEALKDADDSENTQTLVLWYTDAPPHHPTYGGDNMVLEIEAYAPQTTDWVKLTAQAQKKRVTVFTFTPKMADDQASFYAYLAQMTGGLSINQSGSPTSAAISQLTMDVVLSWMGQTVAVAPNSTTFVRQFAQSPLQAYPPPTDEEKESQGYMPGRKLQTLVDETFDVAHVPRGSAASTISQTNLGKRFSDRSQTTYRAKVYESLSSIIATNIMALTRNPVFGQLWRAVCKESDNAETQALVNAFSVKVAQVSNVDEKATLQKWLEDSFDATEAIVEMIEKVPSGGSVVYLDYDADVDISRTDLLEVSRSCYSAVLKKVSSIFTHLKVRDAIPPPFFFESHLVFHEYVDRGTGLRSRSPAKPTIPPPQPYTPRSLPHPPSSRRSGDALPPSCLIHHRRNCARHWRSLPPRRRQDLTRDREGKMAQHRGTGKFELRMWEASPDCARGDRVDGGGEECI